MEYILKNVLIDPTYDIYDKKGKKLDGKYIKCKLGQDKLMVMKKQKKLGYYSEKSKMMTMKEKNCLMEMTIDQIKHIKRRTAFTGEELFDKKYIILDVTYKKIITDELQEDVYDKNRNKSDNSYKKFLSHARVTDIFDKNGDKLDGKYINVKSAFPAQEVYDEN